MPTEEIKQKRIHYRDSVTQQDWTVYEAVFAGQRSLLFECSDMVRRVREFPANWHELNPMDLTALSWKR